MFRSITRLGCLGAVAAVSLLGTPKADAQYYSSGSCGPRVVYYDRPTYYAPTYYPAPAVEYVDYGYRPSYYYPRTVSYYSYRPQYSSHYGNRRTYYNRNYNRPHFGFSYQGGGHYGRQHGHRSGGVSFSF